MCIRDSCQSEQSGQDRAESAETTESQADAVSLSCDPDNGDINLPNGFCAIVVADEIGRARHLWVHDNGDIYVADWNNHRVQKFSTDGAHLLTFGHPGSGPGSLRHPSDVAVDGDGDVYVVDWMNERVVIYDSEAKPLTYLHGDATDVSPWAQMSLEANPDVVKRRRQVDNLADQQKVFRMPVGCAFDQRTNRLIVCDTQRGRLQIYQKESDYADPQYNL